MSFATLTSYELPAVTRIPIILISLVVVGFFSLRWNRVDPALLSLWSLSIVVFFSGHAFTHDWMWLIFVPAVLKIRPIFAIAAAYVIGRLFSEFYRPELADSVSVVSLIGLTICAALTFACLTQQRAATVSDQT